MQAQRLESISSRESGRRAEDFKELVELRAEELRERQRLAKESSEGFADKVKGGWAMPVLSRVPVVGVPLMVASVGLNAAAAGKAMYHEWKMNRAEKDAEREVAQEAQEGDSKERGEIALRRGQWNRSKEAVSLDMAPQFQGEGDVATADRTANREARMYEREMYERERG